MLNSTDRVVERLRSEIIQGVLGEGERLNQEDVAERFGVSRIPVRDALKVLVNEGLVVQQGRSRAVVASISVRDLQEIYELTEVLETLACRLAVPRAGASDVVRMKLLHDQMLVTPDVSTWVELNGDFHGTLYALCDRPRLIAMLNQLRRLKDRYLLLALNLAENVDVHHQQHSALIEAVESQDLQLVEEVTLAHLSTSHDVLIRHFLTAPVSGATAG